MNALARDWRIARARAEELLNEKLFNEADHPRDEHGRWTDGGGSDDAPSDHPGKGYSKNAKLINGVIHTNDVYDAARALHEDRPVELDQPRTASILITKLGEITKDMIAKGEKAPHFNLCRATIKGTSLFCADTQGIPRVKMPQIPEGDEDKFREYLESKGYKVTEENEFASYLRATQNELNGSKVAGVAGEMRKNPNRFPNPVFVSRDNYILDGHHRWAAKVGIDAEDNVLGNESKQNVVRVDISITELLREADEFTGGTGKVSMADEEAEDQGKVPEHDRSSASLREAEDVKEFSAPYQGPDGHGDTRPGVQAYAGQSSSFALNKRLRNPQYGLSSDQEEVVKNLTNEIDASRTTADRLVTRGVDATIVPNLFPGGTITDKGFMSASRRSEWAEQMAHMGQSASSDSGGAVIDIMVPKGARMLTVARSGEDEVILQRGTTLKILSKIRSMNVWRIKAEVIAQ